MKLTAYQSGASGSPPSPPASPSVGYPTAGNPLTPTPATKPGAYWFYQMAAEFSNLFAKAGITPNLTDLTQLCSVFDALTRQRLNSDLTLYISTTGNNSNDGLTAGTPFQTMQYAWDYAQKKYDLNGYILTFQLADGTYNQSFYGSGIFVGQKLRAGVIFNGNPSNPRAVLITSSSTTIVANNNGSFSLKNLKVSSSGAITDHCIFAQDQGSSIDINNNVVIGTSNGGHFGSSYGGGIYINQSYTIEGGATATHWNAGNAGQIHVSTNGVAIVLSGTPSFTDFCSCGAGSLIDFGNVTFSGAATGRKFNVYGNSVLNSGGASVSALPGSTAGVTSTGGVYL